MRETATKNTKQKKALFVQAIAWVFMCMSFLILCIVPVHAYAEDTSNQVDPTQMPDSSGASEVSISDLASSDLYYDNMKVEVVGEVVGDRINADGDSNSCWITLSSTNGSDEGTIPVLMTKSQADQIDSYGAYGVKGTIVQVQGTFHLTCTTHDGTTDLHATSVTVRSEGSASPDSPNIVMIVAGVVLLVFGGGLSFAFWKLRARLR